MSKKWYRVPKWWNGQPRRSLQAMTHHNKDGRQRSTSAGTDCQTEVITGNLSAIMQKWKQLFVHAYKCNSSLSTAIF